MGSDKKLDTTNAARQTDGNRAEVEFICPNPPANGLVLINYKNLMFRGDYVKYKLSVKHVSQLSTPANKCTQFDNSTTNMFKGNYTWTKCYYTLMNYLLYQNCK